MGKSSAKKEGKKEGEVLRSRKKEEPRRSTRKQWAKKVVLGPSDPRRVV